MDHVLAPVAEAVFPCWEQAKANRRDYNEGPWVHLRDELVKVTIELERARLELAKFRQFLTLSQEIILAHCENIPRGTT